MLIIRIKKFEEVVKWNISKACFIISTMTKSEAIGFSQGHIHGDVVEKVFYNDTRTQLEGFWGLQNLNELSTRETIIIPPKIVDVIHQKRVKTDADGKERSAVFGFENNEATITSERVGKNSFYESINNGFIGNFSVGIEDDNSFVYSWKRLFGKPQPILFHTHPFYDQNKFKFNSARVKFPNGVIQKVSPEAYIESSDFHADIFSDVDLQTFFQGNRYLGSLLLSTHFREIYIGPSKLFLNVGMSGLNRLHSIYRKRMDILSISADIQLLGLNADNYINYQSSFNTLRFHKLFFGLKKIIEKGYSLDQLKLLRDNLLVEICNKAGFEVFTTTGKDRSTLNKMRIQDIS